MFDSQRPAVQAPRRCHSYFAAYVMLLFGKQDARRLMVRAAYTYRNAVQNPKVTSRLVAFSSVHEPPAFLRSHVPRLRRRSDTFGDLSQIGYRRARSRGCRVEFGGLSFAFRQLIRPVDQSWQKRSCSRLAASRDARPDPPRRRRPDMAASSPNCPSGQRQVEWWHRSRMSSPALRRGGAIHPDRHNRRGNRR